MAGRLSRFVGASQPLEVGRLYDAETHGCSLQTAAERRALPEMEGLGVAVDGDRLAADHPSRVRREEDAHVGDLAGLHEPGDRLAFHVLALDVLDDDPRAAASRWMTPRMRSPSTDPGQIALARTP